MSYLQILPMVTSFKGRQPKLFNILNVYLKIVSSVLRLIKFEDLVGSYNWYKISSKQSCSCRRDTSIF